VTLGGHASLRKRNQRFKGTKLLCWSTIFGWQNAPALINDIASRFIAAELGYESGNNR
jgi:hypothetical protein